MVAYIKVTKNFYKFDLGSLLYEFFEIFGKKFDFKFGLIDLNQSK
jgi:hypothetical protein